jgi:hypothetical protein
MGTAISPSYFHALSCHFVNVLPCHAIAFHNAVNMPCHFVNHLQCRNGMAW